MDETAKSTPGFETKDTVPSCHCLLVGQRRYIETFVDAVESHADAIDHRDHSGVIDAMRRLLPTDSLLFLMDLSIEPTLASLRQAG